MDDDRTQLEAWRAGDTRAGDRLFVRHFDAVDRFLRNKVGDDAIPDLVQRTFLTCIERPDGFRGLSSFRTFLLGIAHNLLREYYRRSARHSHRDLDEHSVEDLGAGPSTLVRAKEEQRLLLAALRSIPLDAQVVLELFYWEQLSGAELAEVLGVGEDTARTRLRRARLRLAEALERLASSRAVLDSILSDLDSWARSIHAGATVT
ncbi:MAG: sigma-70 family RNA polymerase sigma factor [Myxococcales bacterium]|nr:sigma-70 family RNA polymerase sigma factor [Myxococcales bacterium]